MVTDSSAGGIGPGRAKPLAGQRYLNIVVRGALRTPGIARGIGQGMILLTVVGRKTGKRYSVPTAYTNHEGSLLIGTQFGWGRNFRTGEPVEVRYKGRRRTADVQVITDEEGVVKYYGIICRENASFASFHNIGFDAGGEPKQDDLRETWKAGSRVFRLTLR